MRAAAERVIVGRTGHVDVEDMSAEPLMTATKEGGVIRLSRDPHPETNAYLVVEGPGVLVLLPNRGGEARAAAMSELPEHGSDHNAQLRRAFDALGARVVSSGWSSSSSPQTYLVDGFRALAQQPAVAEDVAHYLGQEPSVGEAIQMLFTSIAMSARADWRSAPPQFRGVAARGWFLGRWVPTFLVLDGPILRFLKSSAFRRQNGSPQFLALLTFEWVPESQCPA